MVLEDITGKKVPAIDVFSLSIKALVKHLMDSLETRGTGVIPNDIQWVLTVPAIWTDNSKQFMRKSAEKVFVASIKVVAGYNENYIKVHCNWLIIFLFISQNKNLNIMRRGMIANTLSTRMQLTLM